jgi:hypothetical protein
MLYLTFINIIFAEDSALYIIVFYIFVKLKTLIAFSEFISNKLLLPFILLNLYSDYTFQNDGSDSFTECAFSSFYILIIIKDLYLLLETRHNSSESLT